MNANYSYLLEIIILKIISEDKEGNNSINDVHVSLEYNFTYSDENSKILELTPLIKDSKFEKSTIMIIMNLLKLIQVNILRNIKK